MKQSQVHVLLIIIICILVISIGCVEVPEQTNRSGQGTNLLSGSVSGGSGTDDEPVPESEESGSSSTGSDSGKPVSTPELPVVAVTPNPHGDVQTHVPVYQNLYNQTVSYEETKLIPIYSLQDQEFLNSGMAFQYSLTNPPAYIVLDFEPKMDSITKVFGKRTGDREGDTTIEITRPNPDAWFEMKIYDKDTGNIVATEGFGKTYTEDLNKTVALRKNGNYQLDFWGSFINTTITIKIPVDKATNEQYMAALQAEAESGNLLGFCYLILPDLPGGWSQTGDEEHTANLYKSTFTHIASGSRFNQVLQKFSSQKEVDSAYGSIYEEVSHLTPRTGTLGEEGVSYTSVRKNGILFKEGLYLVQLDSFSYPPVPVGELEDYAAIIEGRIQSAY